MRQPIKNSSRVPAYQNLEKIVKKKIFLLLSDKVGQSFFNMLYLCIVKEIPMSPSGDRDYLDHRFRLSERLIGIIP